jgi:chaperonin GroES
MAKIRPLDNMLLIRRAESEERTPSGLYIPDKARTKSHRGVVIAAGLGRSTETGFVAVEVEPGDTVLFAEGVGVDVQVDGEPLVMLSEDAVLGVLT